MGKTSLCKRLLGGGNTRRSSGGEDNIASDAHFTYADVETASHVPLRLSLWDLSTQSRYLYPFWWRSSGVFVLFNVTDLDSFTHAKSLITFALEQQRYPVMYVVLIGTHLDELAARKVSSEETRALARFHDVPYFEVNLLKDSLSNLIEVAVRCPCFPHGSFPHICAQVSHYEAKAYASVAAAIAHCGSTVGGR